MIGNLIRALSGKKKKGSPYLSESFLPLSDFSESLGAASSSSSTVPTTVAPVASVPVMNLNPTCDITAIIAESMYAPSPVSSSNPIKTLEVKTLEDLLKVLPQDVAQQMRARPQWASECIFDFFSYDQFSKLSVGVQREMFALITMPFIKKVMLKPGVSPDTQQQKTKESHERFSASQFMAIGENLQLEILNHLREIKFVLEIYSFDDFIKLVPQNRTELLEAGGNPEPKAQKPKAQKMAR